MQDTNLPPTLKTLARSRLSDLHCTGIQIIEHSVHSALFSAPSLYGQRWSSSTTQQLQLTSVAFSQTTDNITTTGDVPCGIVGTFDHQSYLAACTCTDVSPMPCCTHQKHCWLQYRNPNLDINSIFYWNFIANNSRAMAAFTSYGNERTVLFVIISGLPLLALQFYLCSSYPFAMLAAAFALPFEYYGRSDAVMPAPSAPYRENVAWNSGDCCILQTSRQTPCQEFLEILDNVQHLRPVQHVASQVPITDSAEDDTCTFCSQPDTSFTATSSVQVTELADRSTGEICTKPEALEEDSCLKEIAVPSDTLELRADNDVFPLPAADNIDQVNDGLESLDASLLSSLLGVGDEENAYSRFFNWLNIELWVDGFYVSELNRICIIVASGTLMDVAHRNLISSGFGRLNWVLVDSTDSNTGNYIESAVPDGKVPRQAVRGMQAAANPSLLCPPGKILLTPGARIQIGNKSAVYTGWLGGSGLNKKLGMTVGHIYKQSTDVDCTDVFLEGGAHTHVGRTLLNVTERTLTGINGLCFADVALFELDENVFPVNEIYERQLQLAELNLQPFPIRIVIGDREGLLAPCTLKRYNLYGAFLITDCDRRDKITGPGHSGSPVGIRPEVGDLAVFRVPAMVTGFIDGPLPGQSIHLPSATSITIACPLRPALNAIESISALKSKLGLDPSGTLTGIDFGDMQNLDSGFFS